MLGMSDYKKGLNSLVLFWAIKRDRSHLRDKHRRNILTLEREKSREKLLVKRANKI